MSTTQNKIKLQYLTRIDFDAASLTTNYQAIASAFSQPVRILKIKNFSNRTIDISTDGTNNHDIVGANTGDVTDCSASHNTHEAVCLPKGTQFSIKSTAGAGTGIISFVLMVTV